MVVATEAPAATGDRIARLRRRYQEGPAFISVARARLYTESWRATEAAGPPLDLRVARAMQHVYAHMPHYVDPDDRIAGYWTEHFLGVPVDIERGVFNEVFAAELKKSTLVRYRARAALKAGTYLLRKGALGDFLHHQRIARQSRTPPLNMELKTMAERAINPYRIAPDDRELLLRDLLPYWKGRSLADHLQRALEDAGLFSRDMHDLVTGMAGNTSRQVMLLSAAATIATIQGHVILDYAPVLEKGLLGMRDDVAARLRGARPETSPFLQASAVALDGVITYAERLAEAVSDAADAAEDAAARDALRALHAVCARAPLRPAETFREAVQALWTVKTAVELAHPVNLHCFGRLDQVLHPYYRRDIEGGRVTPGAACELLQELLLKIMSQNVRPESNILANFYHRFLGSSPVTLGGVDADGNDATNELTYLFLDAAHASKAITNVSVRVHPGTPDAVLDRVAAHLRAGTSSFSLFNDETSIAAMRRHGIPERDARDYAVMGCVETTVPGKTGAMSACALMLSKLLDMTLRDGDAMTVAGRLRGEGPRTGDPAGFPNFDALVEAYLAQARHAIGRIVEASNLRDRLYEERLPAPHVSVFMDGCLESGRDVTRGGARYDLSGISMINSIANVTDSLLAIRELVYRRRQYTFAQLLTALDANYRGHEGLLRDIRAVPHKWGNGGPDSDALAARIMAALCAETRKHTNHRCGPFVVYVISMITHTVDGRLSAATPDGRKAATPYAASCNPYNVERNGPTAVMRSVAALPNAEIMGAAVNMRFHPSAIGKTPETRAKWAGLVRAYFALGGAQVQPTVAGAKMLRAARDHPEDYRDLIVKVGGYSTYFVDLGREIQDEIIARTEHGRPG